MRTDSLLEPASSFWHFCAGFISETPEIAAWQKHYNESSEKSRSDLLKGCNCSSTVSRLNLRIPFPVFMNQFHQPQFPYFFPGTHTDHLIKRWAVKYIIYLYLNFISRKSYWFEAQARKLVFAVDGWWPRTVWPTFLGHEACWLSTHWLSFPGCLSRNKSTFSCLLPCCWQREFVLRVEKSPGNKFSQSKRPLKCAIET